MTANAMQGDREKCIAAGMDDYLAKPVRPEDIRHILERWGPRAAAACSAPTASAGPRQPAASSRHCPAAPATPPVDMERLLDFANGDPDNLRELVELYLQQTAKQLDQLSAAVEGAQRR